MIPLIPLSQCRKCLYISLNDPSTPSCEHLAITGHSQLVANRGRKEGEPCRCFKPRQGAAPKVRAMQFRQPSQRPTRPAEKVVHYNAKGEILAVYNSAAEASKSTGVHRVTIYNLCSYNRQHPKEPKGLRGQSFRYLKKGEKIDGFDV